MHKLTKWISKLKECNFLILLVLLPLSVMGCFYFCLGMFGLLIGLVAQFFIGNLLLRARHRNNDIESYVLKSSNESLSVSLASQEAKITELTKALNDINCTHQKKGIRLLGDQWCYSCDHCGEIFDTDSSAQAILERVDNAQ